MTKHICRALLVGALLFIPVSVGYAAHTPKKSASTKTPCWVTITNEAAAGAKIKTTFPEYCYQQAVDRLPAAVLIYSDMRQEIDAAAVLAGFKLTNPPGVGSGTATSTTTSSGSAESFPVVLIVIGVVAVLLVISGIAGVLWRRSHPESGGDEPPDGPVND